MKEKFTNWFNNLLPIEQKAAKISVICSGVFLTVLLGTIISVSILGAISTSDSVFGNDSSSYQNEFPLDTEKLQDTILPKTKDAGEEYLNDTLFVGDSNTVAYYQYGLLPLNQVAGKVGIGVSGAMTEKCCYFENDSNAYTIVETIAKMKPRRVIFNFGTNNAPYHTTEQFIEEYKKVLDETKKVYPYTEIIVSAVYPIAQKNDYPEISMGTIDAYNQALAEMCQQEGYKFLNTSEILKGSDGYLQSGYANGDGIHLKSETLKSILVYVREHAYDTEDRRPDTNDIPDRRNVKESDSSNSSTELSASYYVEVSDGKTYGTLQGDGFSNETSKQFKISSEQNEFTVTAVPNDGYEFVRWSDGVETATRTDKNITKNLSVTAIFRPQASISISASTTTVRSSGEEVSFKATISGNRNNGEITWQLNGKTLSSIKGESVSFNVKPGDKVTASIGNITSPAITFNLKAQLSVSQSSKTCNVGDNVTFTANGDGLPLNDVVWKVNGKQQATGKSFNFKATQAGSYTITASVEGQDVSVQLNVQTPVTPPPAETPVPATPTPEPTATPTLEPTATPTPTPTDAPLPTVSPNPTATPVPTLVPPPATPEPEPSDAPSSESLESSDNA